MHYEWIGALSGIILLSTLIGQCRQQWQQGTTRGVSKLFFSGQIITSIGFVVYSALLKNWVFILTNAAILCSALVGEGIYWRNRRRQSSSSAADSRPA